jgi:uncharacterized protein YicC (UPF0701 family)
VAPLYREKEMEIRNFIAQQVERGKLDFALWIEKKDATDVMVPINQSTMAAYYKRLSEIVEETGIPESTARAIYASAKEKLRRELR